MGHEFDKEQIGGTCTCTYSRCTQGISDWEPLYLENNLQNTATNI